MYNKIRSFILYLKWRATAGNTNLKTVFTCTTYMEDVENSNSRRILCNNSLSNCLA